MAGAAALAAALSMAAFPAHAVRAADTPGDTAGPSAPGAADSTGAAPAAPDSLAAPAGSAAPADSAAERAGVVTTGAAPSARRAPARAGFFDVPGWVMMRSAVLPGWGQWHNRQWVKAAVIGGAEVWMGYRIYDDNRVLDDLERAALAARAAGDAELANALTLRYNDRLDTMVARQWMLGGIIVYALLDAYVDAHFRDFDIEFETDPALPGDDPSSSGMRARLRWSF